MTIEELEEWGRDVKGLIAKLEKKYGNKDESIPKHVKDDVEKITDKLVEAIGTLSKAKRYHGGQLIRMPNTTIKNLVGYEKKQVLDKARIKGIREKVFSQITKERDVLDAFLALTELANESFFEEGNRVTFSMYGLITRAGESKAGTTYNKYRSGLRNLADKKIPHSYGKIKKRGVPGSG